MKQITLEIFLLLLNIQSPSGLIYQDDHIHLIGDDTTYFYSYDTQEQFWSQNPLTYQSYGERQIPKQIKPDFEAITSDQMDFYVFGSGSKQNRIDLVRVNKMTYEIQEIEKLDLLYESMMDIAQISTEDFNIEGVIKDDQRWYFFNRGNGPGQKNGIFVVDAPNIVDHFQVYYKPIKLPKIDKVQAGFTDATLVGNTIYFIAASEHESSTYHDGQIKGSLIGEMDLEKLKVKRTKVISKELKFEGITFYKQQENRLSFLLCEDPDNPLKQTAIYELSFTK